jgi:anaerobic selenocysteine-containing dehydrogenase
MHEPAIEAVYVVGPTMPLEIREALAERLGAREGDTVIMRTDGSVALGRRASDTDARAVTRHLRRLPARSGRRPGHLHLLD